MLSKLFLVLAVASVAVFLHVFRWHNARRNKRRRQELIANGVAAPRPTPLWQRTRSYVRILPVVPLVVAMIYFEPRLKRVVSPPWDQVILFGGMFVVVFIAVIAWQIFRRDRAVTGALRVQKAGDVERAIEMLKATIQQSPTAARHNALGSVFSQEERWEEAYRSFEEARTLAPEQPIHLVNCAMTLSKLNRSGEAIALTQAGRAQFPFDAAVQLAEAIVLAESDRHDEAAERMRQSVEFERVAPDNQRVDWLTRAKLRKIGQERVQASSTRGFQVTPVVPQAQATADEPSKP